MQTDENILKEALESIMKNEDLLFGEEPSNESSILCEYAINELGPEASNEEISRRMSQIYTDFLLENLIAKGIVDYEFSENGEVIYSLTEKGNE